MAKNPILPLYYNDIRGTTQSWTDEEFGAYMRLLMEQWDKGGLPNDSQRLARLCTSFERNWSQLKAKFPLVDGLLKNLVMEEIREKRAKFSKKQSLNAKRIAKSKPNQSQNPSQTYEYENEYELDLNSDKEFEEIFCLHLDGYRRNFPLLNIEQELEKFKTKVRGDPKKYAGRDGGGLRTAFQYHLSHTKPKHNGKEDKRNIGSDGIIESGKSFGKL